MNESFSMNPSDIARNLLDLPRESRPGILASYDPLPGAEIAEALQQVCYEVWTHDPQKVSEIASTLSMMAEITGDQEVEAYQHWTEAIEALVGGQLEACLERIESSESGFLSIGKRHLAAKTQTSKLYAFALLGRYDEAVECGLGAREVFLAHEDLYSTGKIEHNIGNLYWRRDMYRESEPYLSSAHECFRAIGDQRQMAMVENSQAFVKSLQNQFRDAEKLYLTALDRTAVLGLTVTEAEIETGLSNLYLFEGRYDLALSFMERSRQKYESLDMVNQSANCDLEIADIYLELNLLPEATDHYRRARTRFQEIGVQAELARCLKNHALARLRLGEVDEARLLLDRSQQLFENEGNAVSVGSVMFARANLLLAVGDLSEAEAQVNQALDRFAQGENLRLELYARWLRAEIRRSNGNITDAEDELRSTLAMAARHSTQVEYLCCISLGELTGNESHFIRAVELVESSRSSLVSEDLRTSYFAEKVRPYDQLVRTYLRSGQYPKAFRWHERSRGRTMMDSMVVLADPDVSSSRITELRKELKWLNNRLNRSTLSGTSERKQIVELKGLVLEREKEYAELKRRLKAGSLADIADIADIDISAFSGQLRDTTVVEFAAIGGRISAFVISASGFDAVSEFADEQEIRREVAQLLFQIKTGRFIDRLSPANQAAATERLERHSRRVYDLLLRPLGPALEADRLVFAPAGFLHYLPFHALSDGAATLLERSEVSYTPSVSLLDRCLKMPPADIRQALLVGVINELTPHVASEIERLSGFFADPITLVGSDATLANISGSSGETGLVHLACHGKFRPDSPGFSSLVLFDEEMSVNDVHQLRFQNSIIVLSACESGLNKVVRGEELIGLTQAFFASGASSLVMSLWRVNDTATLELMTEFYRHLSDRKGIAGALRLAQLHLLEKQKHPYFWAPFRVSGRW